MRKRTVPTAGAVFAVCLSLGVATVAQAQIFHLPKMPGSKGQPKKPDKNDKNADNGPAPAGVPVAMDSPVIVAFQKLEQEKAYRWTMEMPDLDPQMAKMMEQYGIRPAETVVQGDTKLVTMHYEYPSTDEPGTTDKWTVLAVSRNGRAARKFTSPSLPRMLAKSDAKFAKDMAELNKAAAQGIAKSLQNGPMGLLGAGVQAAATAAEDIALPEMYKKSKEMFEWQCAEIKGKPVDKTAPPPLTDLRPLADSKIEGADVAVYEFYVKENGRFQGPLHMSIYKDSGLPARIEMSDKRMPGTMRIAYSDFGKTQDIEIPACLEK